MAVIAPVRALCYPSQDLSSVTAPPYDDVDKELFHELAERSKYNVVRIDLPRGSGLERYRLAADRLSAWMARGVLGFGERPSLIDYTQRFQDVNGNELVRRSFLGLLRIEPYGSGVAPHEKTLLRSKEDRYQLFRATRAHLSPVFMLYQDPEHAVMRCFEDTHPITEFTDHEGVTHTLRSLRDPHSMKRVAALMRKTSLIIADGHHRYEAALRCSEDLAREGEDGPNAAHRYLVATFVSESDPGLQIRPTHRILRAPVRLPKLEKRLAPWVEWLPTTLSPQDALSHMGEAFAVMVQPDAVHFLRARVPADECPPLAGENDAVRDLPVSWLHRVVFDYGLGIGEDEQAQGRVVKFKRDPEATLARLAKKKTGAVFLMPASSMEQVREACESHAFMPQKSTAFFPKVPAGLAIHTFPEGATVTPLS